jgi:ABC-2 type transport system ATP-binding protein
METIIECRDLSKTYNKRVLALDTCSLTIEQGAAFGLLGENGAGKSTLVRLLMGFILPSSGQLRIFGTEEVTRIHRRIGYVHEKPIFENAFTGRRFLRYLAELSGLYGTTNQRRIQEVLDLVKLGEAADRKIGQYSKGMVQRLAIAQALLTNPDLLIFDEPTSGLDPRSQWEVRQIIAGLRNQGKTILICSHYLTEVEALCNVVGILRRGKLILTGRVADLLHGQDTVEIALPQELSAEDLVYRLSLNEMVIGTQANILRIRASEQALVLNRLVSAEVPLLSLNPLNRTLEEVYVQATRRADEQLFGEVAASNTSGATQ